MEAGCPFMCQLGTAIPWKWIFLFRERKKNTYKTYSNLPSLWSRRKSDVAVSRGLGGFSYRWKQYVTKLSAQRKSIYDP